MIKKINNFEYCFNQRSQKISKEIFSSHPNIGKIRARMIKKILTIIICAIFILYPVSASNMYNYVYNGTSWVPALATADGQSHRDDIWPQKHWINNRGNLL
jgi:hypothetical protein